MTAVLIDRIGNVGYLTLNSPETLNALTHDMIQALRTGLLQHETDPAVQTIVLGSASSGAFCAGGDMKRTREQAINGQWSELRRFFADEYELNLRIARSKKPYVSLIDGIAMGGGLGISVHGTYRVVSPNARLAMPETAIGFFPDVGGTHFLSRLPYDAGLWLALTGIPISPQQSVALGLATHLIEAEKWPEILSTLHDADAQNLPELLERYSEPVLHADYVQVFRQRAQWFTAPGNDAVMRNLVQAEQASTASTDGIKSDDEIAVVKDAQALADRLKLASPYAMNLTRELLDRAKKKSLADCLRMELEAGVDAVRHPDFIEGIRAVLVDKDRTPVWVS